MNLVRDLLPTEDAVRFETTVRQIADAIAVTQKRYAYLLRAAGVAVDDVVLVMDQMIGDFDEVAEGAMHLGLWEGEWK